MLQRSLVVLTAVVCIGAFAAAGCGSSSSSTAGGGVVSSSTTTSTQSTSLPTTKFILHFGLAAGAFHRYIYKPFKAGAFHHLLSHKIALLKAALAALFVYHELKLAVADAEQSKILHPLVAPIQAFAAKFTALRSQLSGGTADPTAINAAQAGGGAIAAAAAAKGVVTGDLPVPSL